MSGQGNDQPGASGSGSNVPKPGTPSRLPSFKGPRDLSLGSSTLKNSLPGALGRKGVPGLADPNKKKFAPNLNVQRRDRSKETQIKTEIKTEPDANNRGQRGRGSGPATRGGRGKPDLIQTIGSVFSDGMGADGAIRRRGGFGGGGGGGDGGGGGGLERPKINLKSLDEKFDKAAEDEKLKEFLRDDFIEDLTTGNIVPVQLPMQETGKVFKEVKKEEDEDEDDLRIMRGGKMKPKKSNMILDSDDESESKPEESKTVIKIPKKESCEKVKTEINFSDLVRGQVADMLDKETSQVDDGTSSTVKSESEIFDFLLRLQSSRLDNQRYTMPVNIQTLPSSMLVKGEFWTDPPMPFSRPTQEMNTALSKLEFDNFSKVYRHQFANSEHFNFRVVDEVLSPVLISVKVCDENASYSKKKTVNLIARLSSCTINKTISIDDLDDSLELVPSKLARLILPEMQSPRLEPVLFPGATSEILNFDEHRLTKTYKFGLIYQKPGQCTEEAMLSNKQHSQAMHDFMLSIGKIITLANHAGYPGGLDSRNGHTGKFSLYETFDDNEIMFHVSTFLPYQDSDPQQLQRKCHIGNDIVAIVFQDEDTPFSPEMIKSQFLHTFIVVHPHGGPMSSEYKVKVLAQKDVPYFGPVFPGGRNILKRGRELKEFLLTKLVNAETACYQADKFAALELRTRTALISDLDQNLANKTKEFLSGSGDKKHSHSIFVSMKRAFTGKERSLSTSESFKEPKMLKSKSEIQKSNQKKFNSNRNRTSPSRLSEPGNLCVDVSQKVPHSKFLLSPNFIRTFSSPSRKSTRFSHCDTDKKQSVECTQHRISAPAFESKSIQSDLLSTAQLEKDLTKLKNENLRLQGLVEFHKNEIREFQDKQKMIESQLADALDTITTLKKEKENNNVFVKSAKEQESKYCV